MIIDYNPSNETEVIVSPVLDPRNIRNKLLQNVDRVNPIWYASLSADQQAELTAYRQALLDVPQQAEFPTVINWPAKPSWLT